MPPFSATFFRLACALLVGASGFNLPVSTQAFAPSSTTHHRLDLRIAHDTNNFCSAGRIWKPSSLLSIRLTGTLLVSRCHHQIPCLKASLAVNSDQEDDNQTFNDNKLPSTVTPLLLTVLALIVSEGIALSTLPLHLQSLGATPVQVGMSTSAFSVAQMVMCPLIVALSSKSHNGRQTTLSLCLAGAALSSLVIAASRTIPLLIAARFVAGIFAAAIPVAQAGVVDLVPPHQQTLALSRVSAASQTGLVIGPMASAVVQSILRRVLGLADSDYLVRGVFLCSATFALLVMGLSIRGKDSTDSISPLADNINDDDGVAAKLTPASSNDSSATGNDDATAASKHTSQKEEQSTTAAAGLESKAKFVQPMLRIIALAAGWSLTLSVAIYSLFASRFLHYGQSQLSLTYSAGAAMVIATQIFIVPSLVHQVGEHMSCTIGLLGLAIGLAGASLIRAPLALHALFYGMIRMAQGITDTSTATLVAQASQSSEERATNLGMIQSTRAGARIFTPLLSGSLFANSCVWFQGTRLAGALPYLVNAGLALALTPLPLILRRMKNNGLESKENANK